VTKFLSRKFLIALIFTVSGCAALFLTDKIDGGQFVTLALGISGLFTAGDAAINAIQKRNVE
jgi:hypothetical protein